MVSAVVYRVGGFDVFGATESQIRNRVICGETAAEAEAHESRVVSKVRRIDGSTAAEEFSLELGVATGFAGDEGGVEVVDPFPNQAMHSVDAVDVSKCFWFPLFDGLIGATVPFEDAGVVAFFFAAIDIGFAGESNEFPFGYGWEAFAFPASIGATGEPRNVDGRKVFDGFGVWAKIKIACPVVQIGFVCENGFNLRATPGRVGGDEFQEFPVGNRAGVD